MHSTPHLYVGWKPLHTTPHICNLYPIAIVLFRTVLLRATGAVCYARVLYCINRERGCSQPPLYYYY